MDGWMDGWVDGHAKAPYPVESKKGIVVVCVNNEITSTVVLW
jgi:hypothetical protein